MHVDSNNPLVILGVLGFASAFFFVARFVAAAFERRKAAEAIVRLDEGERHIREGDIEAAIRCFIAVMVDNPTNTVPYLKMAQIYDKQGKTQDAITYYNSFIGKTPIGTMKTEIESAIERVKTLEHKP